MIVSVRVVSVALVQSHVFAPSHVTYHQVTVLRYLKSNKKYSIRLHKLKIGHCG